MKRYIIPVMLIFVLAIAGATVGSRLRAMKDLPAQPIAFNHRLHLEKAQGITCADCHSFVTTETYAGLPSKQLCFDCHEVEDPGESEASEMHAELVALMRFADVEHDIPWERVTETPSHVFFSHRRHVAVAGIDCADCHPTMAERTVPPTRGPIVMKMDVCLDCHEAQDASEDCVACHR
jgi:c(7)-type cytochrome triheme protein